MDEPVVSTMSAILTDIGTVVTSAIGWMGSFVNFITSNPLILLFIVVAFVGLAIGLIRRLIAL